MNSIIVHGWIKKTGSEPSEREKRYVTTKLSELNSFHSHKERKKETSDEQNGLPQSLKMARMCLACRAPEIWKNGSVNVVGSAICKVTRLVSGGTEFATSANFGQPEPV